MENLRDELIELLRLETKEAEQNGALTEKQLHSIYYNNWFNLFVPKEFGGLGLSLPDAVRLEEQLARIDGSVGWVVTLCAGANMFIGYLEESLRNQIFDGNIAQICFAGSGRANGVATPNADGYLVSGSWPYASGAPHATHFTANCKVGEEIWSFVFLRNEVRIQEDWNYLGLNATAGHSFVVEELWVPGDRKFQISAAQTKLSAPVFRYPFQQLAEATIAVNVFGMCSYFIELVEKTFGTRFQHEPSVEANERSIAELQVDRMHELVKAAKNEMQGLHTSFYKALDRSWESHIRNVAEAVELGRVSSESRKLARRSRELIEAIYPYCGMHAARMDTDLNQVWRNIHTASQHKALC